MAISIKYKGYDLKFATFPTPEEIQSAYEAVASKFKELLRRGDKPVIERVARDGQLPLSFGQQRVWFLDQLEPGNPFYNMPVALRLSGRLDVKALERSINLTAERHETLRTTFHLLDGQPVQSIHKELALTLPLANLSLVPEDARENMAATLARDEAQRPFDLTTGPMLRALLLRLREDEHALLLTMHHIISDGWSMRVLVKELTMSYEAALGESAAVLPELPLQYADFAVWQREQLRGEALAGHLAYWRKQLGGELPLLSLPTDHPRPVIQSSSGSRYTIALGKELTEELKALSRREGVTLFMTLLAGFKVLLSRYSHQQDIIVGTPVANRHHPDMEALIGMFSNTLVLRADLSGDPTFTELLQRIKEVCLGAYAHQELPFEKLVEELQPERDLSRNSLFQVMFNLLNIQNASSVKPLELNGLNVTPLQFDSGISRFDLTLLLIETDQGLRGELEYNTDLFEADSIARMAEHLLQVLDEVIAHPLGPLSSLSLLSPSDLCLLSLFNQTSAPLPDLLSLPQLFLSQVGRSPLATALISDDQLLSYAELNAAANQLARHLRQLGVGSESVVGVCLPRSIQMVVALLAVLKAGAAYLPLDAEYPSERLRLMMTDSGARVVVTEARLRQRVESSVGEAVVVSVDEEAAEISGHSGEELAVEVRGENLAYVIYTSGSTGVPKGVMIEHRSLLNFLTSMAERPGVEAGDTLLALTSISFDIAGLELFLPLCLGGRVVLSRQEDVLSGTGLATLIHQHHVTVMQATPSTYRLLLESDAAVFSRGLVRKVLCGGEALSGMLAEQLLAEGVELWNMYGPTETTIWSSVEHVQGPQPAVVALGSPIRNTQIYVLDEQQEVVPVNVPGELYIGGAGVARGYLGRAELTAERFIPDRYGEESGRRLYRTGDVGRLRGDGSLEYLGRTDEQVKIRGYRVELGEIEAVLESHRGVRESAVKVVEGYEGEKRIVAYYVREEGEEGLSAVELRSYLREQLPEYMMPSGYVQLERMPLTPNGKVDRQGLPAPDKQRPEVEQEYVRARTPVEEVLAAVWREVLGLEEVGIYDNFFEIGGDSILSIQITSRANQIGLHLTPKELFQYQTIAELAKVADGRQKVFAEQGLVTGPVPLTSWMQWFFEQDVPDPHYWNQSLLFGVGQALKPALLEEVMDHLLLHHDALRLRFEREGASWRAFIVEAENSRIFSHIDLTNLKDAPQQQQSAIIEAVAVQLQESFNLTDGPIIRVALFDLGPDEPCRLMITIHHLAIDGVSWRILIEDLQSAYHQLSDAAAPLRSRPNPPPSKSGLSASSPTRTPHGSRLKPSTGSRLCLWQSRPCRSTTVAERTRKHRGGV